MRTSGFNVLLLGLALAVTPASAKTKAKPAVPAAASDAPAAHPVSDGTGKFAFCLLDYPQPGGRKLTVALSPENEINLGLTIPKGGFKLGAHYDLQVAFGAAPARLIHSTAVEPEGLLLQLGADAAIAKDLQTATHITATAGGHSLDFATPDFGAAYQGLQRCNKTNAGKTNPAQAKVEAAMPEPLKALLVAAGFTDIRPLSMDDIPPDDRPADFVWLTGKLLGGVRERNAPKGKSLTELVGLHVQGLKQKCTGEFKAELDKEIAAPGITMRPALVECKMDDHGQVKDIIVAILFYLAGNGHFTAFTHEADVAQKAEALAARDAIRKALADLATGTNDKAMPIKPPKKG